MGTHRVDAAVHDPGLRKGLRTFHVWALGVGIVVCGQYFGWNLGLKDGPIALLAASLLVCLLFLAWALTLSELTVAMPSAGGPLDWGLRAGGPWLGFLMGWSLLLECFFGGVATALAAGGYVAFLLNPESPDGSVTVLAALATVVVFFLLQVWGVREQALALLLMTSGALVALAVFWIVAGTHFSWDRVWPSPVLPSGRGWGAVGDAVPYALWWLIIIEGAALAAEESHRPERAIPAGLTAAVLTTAVLLVLTLGTACGALDASEIMTRNANRVHYPLAEVLRQILAGRSLLLLYGFGTVALLGLVASYHGLLYGTSRQLYALGRADCLPGWLGSVHAVRQTPVAALAAGSVLTATFIIASLWLKEETVEVAVLAAGFAALVLYILSMCCLVSLRRREPQLFQAWRAPLPRLLPIVVAALSVFALLVYRELNARVVLLTYAVGLGYFGLRWLTRGKPARTAPLPEQSTVPASPPIGAPAGWLDRLAAALLVAVLLTTAGLTLAGQVGEVPHLLAPDVEMVALLALLVVTLGVLAAVALRHGRSAEQGRGDRGGGV